MNFDDASESSETYFDLPNISAIPKSNSIQRMEKLNLQGSNMESLSITDNANSVHTIPISPLDRTAEKLTVCNKNIKDYTESKIIYNNLVQLCSNDNSTLSKTTSLKLKKIIKVHEMKKHMSLAEIGSELMEKLTILGISLEHLQEPKLSEVEKSEIKSELGNVLRIKLNKFTTVYEQLGGNIQEVMKIGELNVRHKLEHCLEVPHHQWKVKIEEIVEDYEKKLIQHAELLNRWNELQNKDVNEIYSKKANILLLKSQVLALQARLIRITCVFQMFEETPHTVEAFEIVRKQMRDKLYKVRNEIEEKKKLKESYDQVRGLEYDTILQEYTKLCDSINANKNALDAFRKE